MSVTALALVAALFPYAAWPSRSYTSCSDATDSVATLARMDATGLGLWLAGIGAAGSIAVLLSEPPPLGRGGMTFNSPESVRPERIRKAIRLVSAVLVGSGSIVVAVAQCPPWWIVAATAVGATGAVWLHGAWSQHRLWRDKLKQLEQTPREARAAQGLASAYETAARCARWRWALLHPFNGETWPGSSRTSDA